MVQPSESVLVREHDVTGALESTGGELSTKSAELPSVLGMSNDVEGASPFKCFELIRHDGWLCVTLNSGPSNYLNEEVVGEMASLISEAVACEAIKCVVLGAGEKRVFSRGIERRSFLSASMKDRVGFVERSNALLSAIAAAPVPVICAVNGVCAGAGLELAIACDFRIASDAATFCAPEAIFGLVPGGGISQRLLRQVGWGQCIRLLASGAMISAAEALRVGLVEEVVAPGELAERCEYTARRIARAPRSALVAIKNSVIEGIDLPLSTAVQRDLRRSTRILRDML